VGVTFRMKQLIYFCADMRAMREFYCAVLGLKLIENKLWPVEEWVELDGGGFKLCLHKAGSAGAKAGTKNKLVFWVEDVADARAYLVERGVKMGVHHHWGEIDASDGRDPEGNKFQVAGPPTKEG
jgi:catechol 2,3-dioxygenase-like lactoylglutathione lyase family enzyme